MTQWRPAAVADGILSSPCSNPAPKPSPTYTFGHGIAKGAAAAAPPEQDLAAALWWQSRGARAPTTTRQRDADISLFWSTHNGHAASAIHDLTGREVARAVKKAGRGAHVDLRCEGAPPATASHYKAAFCAHHDAAAASLGVEANPVAYAMYEAAKVAAKANKALGQGSSVNLSCLG